MTTLNRVQQMPKDVEGVGALGIFRILKPSQQPFTYLGTYIYTRALPAGWHWHCRWTFLALETDLVSVASSALVGLNQPVRHLGGPRSVVYCDQALSRCSHSCCSVESFCRFCQKLVGHKSSNAESKLLGPSSRIGMQNAQSCNQLLKFWSNCGAHIHICIYEPYSSIYTHLRATPTHQNPQFELRICTWKVTKPDSFCISRSFNIRRVRV